MGGIQYSVLSCRVGVSDSVIFSCFVLTIHKLCVIFSDLDNHWICKPFNLARGLDTLISKDLSCLLRLSESGPKVRIIVPLAV